MHTIELGERGIIYQYDYDHVWKNGMVFTCDTFIFGDLAASLLDLSSIYVSFFCDHHTRDWSLSSEFYVGVYEQRFYRQKRKLLIKMA